MRIVQGRLQKQARRVLVGPGNLIPPSALIRAQSLSRSTSLLTDDTTWAEYLADEARYFGSARALLIGQQRTNSIRNPRAEGFTAGDLSAGGVMPINWTSPTISQGVAVTVVGGGATNGVQWLDIRCQGTTTAPWNPNFIIENTTAIPASNGQVWTFSMWAQVVSGTWPLGTAVLGIAQHQGGTFLGVVNGTSFTGDLGNWTRKSAVLALNQAAVDNIRPRFHANANTITGAVVDFTIRIGWPQAELGGFASTPILPPTGSPAAATRGRDNLQYTLSSLGVAGNGACTVLFKGSLDAVSTGTAQALFVFGDGTDSNGVELVARTAVAELSLTRVAAGASANAFTGTLVSGAGFSAGVSNNGAGTAACSFGGAAPISVTGVPISGFTDFRCGARFGSGIPMAGRILALSVLPYALSDAALQAAVTSL